MASTIGPDKHADNLNPAAVFQRFAAAAVTTESIYLRRGRDGEMMPQGRRVNGLRGRPFSQRGKATGA
jgi:hypothetical protein